MRCASYRVGQHQQAQSLCEQILLNNPRDAQALHLSGVIYATQGHPQRAVMLISRAIRLNENVPEFHNNLGLTFHRLSHFGQAVQCYRAALALCPTSVEAHLGLGAALVEQGYVRDAIPHFEKAVALRADHPDAHFNLGNAHERLGQLQEAERVYRRALELKPDDARREEALADCLRRQGRIDDALAGYRRSQRNSHEKGVLRLKELLTLPVIMESNEQIRSLRSQLEEGLDDLLEDPPTVDGIDRIAGVSTFYLTYQGLNDRSIQEKVARLKQRMDPSLNFVADRCRSDGRPSPPGSPVRIGFVSNFFYGHTIAKLNAGLIAKLDRSRFETFVFAFPRPMDPWRQRVIATADTFVELPRRLGPARQILSTHKLDVLIYTDIGMDHMTGELAFSRLAPVQCVTWGHPVTTGIGTIDYFLSSVDLETDAAEAHYTERLVQLDHLSIYYYRPVVPEPTKTRADLGLPESVHLYVCPQTLFKLHPDQDQLFGGILEADDRGQIILIEGQDPAWRKLLQRRFERHIPHVAQRIKFIPRLDTADFFHLLATADVLLDPIHFGGGNTSLEAFAVAAPVITLPSAFLRGRITRALYRQTGIDDCIVSSPSQYVRRAVEIGTRGEEREEIRVKMRAAAPQLYENSRGVRDFEDFVLSAVHSSS